MKKSKKKKRKESKTKKEDEGWIFFLKDLVPCKLEMAVLRYLILWHISVVKFLSPCHLSNSILQY